MTAALLMEPPVSLVGEECNFHIYPTLQGMPVEEERGVVQPLRERASEKDNLSVKRVDC